MNTLKNQYIKLWENTPDTFPSGWELFSDMQRHEKDRRMGSYTDEIILLVKGFSDNNDEYQSRWGTSLKKLLFNCGFNIIGLDSGSMDFLLNGGFCETTSAFITQAREFDEGFKTDDIMQALRNVWIMNCIQKLTGQRIEATPATFAYSMLYPYTDNYLDAPSVSDKKKLQVNDRFERRLAGELLEPGSSYESKLFSLVHIIEQQYARSEYPMVYESLLGIHTAQSKSILQHGKKGMQSSSDILQISIEKGGASVYADACLVKGRLSAEESSFMFGFGVLLQFLDDLQDAAVDRNNGHHTIFSKQESESSAERNTNRLINFLQFLLEEDRCFTSSDAKQIKNIMTKSILFLLLGAAACNSRMYSRSYLTKLEGLSPLSFSYLKSFYKRIGREYGKLRIKLAVKPIEVSMAKAFASATL